MSKSKLSLNKGFKRIISLLSILTFLGVTVLSTTDIHIEQKYFDNQKYILECRTTNPEKLEYEIGKLRDGIPAGFLLSRQELNSTARFVWSLSWGVAIGVIAFAVIWGIYFFIRWLMWGMYFFIKWLALGFVDESEEPQKDSRIIECKKG